MSGQSAMEFIAMFMILLAALAAISFVSYNQLAGVSQYQTDIEVEEVLSDAVLKINTAYLEGDGFMINLTVPEKIRGSDYDISITGNEVRLTISGIAYTKQVLTSDIIGAIDKGLNTVRNENGGIYIT